MWEPGRGWHVPTSTWVIQLLRWPSSAARRVLPYPVEEPAMRLLEGLALLELQRVDESTRALSGAITAADSLLALADRNVAALHIRALALSGLAVAAGDPARFAEAGEAFARARTVTSAVGVTADSRRMLDWPLSTPTG